MKTIFALLPVGLTIRNFVFTGILDKLAARQDVKVVVFTHESESLTHARPFDPKLVFSRFPKRSRYTLAQFVHRALKARWEKINENRALRSQMKTSRFLSPRLFLLDTLVSQPFPKRKRIYDGMRAIGRNCGGVTKEVQALFDQHRPSLVLATNPTRMTEYSFLNHARSSGVKTVGMLKSWDTILTKGYIPAPTDYYLVWTPVMKRDLMRLYGVPNEAVGVTGIPQFDIYAEPVSASKRGEFLKQCGLDPMKKTILFATSAPWTDTFEPAILDRFAQSLDAGNVQILARLHPMDNPLRYQSVRHPHLAYQFPGSASESRVEARYLDPTYLPRLRDAIAYSDVVINTASTMTLDAVALGKPVINLSIDLEPVDYALSAEQYYEFDHYKPIVQSGAVKIARSLEELTALSHRYLGNPHLESEERSRLCETMCHRLDGQSAQRVADHLFCVLDGTPLYSLEGRQLMRNSA